MIPPALAALLAIAAAPPPAAQPVRPAASPAEPKASTAPPGPTAPKAARAAAGGGRLVLLVVVDQLRYQDVLWLASDLGPRGFAGLGRPAPMRYDTPVTETAADHAVLSTGAYADLNGVVGNHFFDDQGDHESVDDPLCPVWGADGVGRSAAQLRVPTVGDAFKLGTNGAGRVVSIALKDRSALFLAGPSADVALWFETAQGRVTSSACYGEAPPAWLSKLWAEHPLSEWQDWVWSPLHEGVLARTVPLEQTQGAVPRFGMGPVFPHRVGHGKADKELAAALRSTPAATTIALQAANAAISALGLGERTSVDLLEVAVSSVDGVGHQFGTASRERVDAVLRAHEELSAFFGGLRARLGQRLSIVLTADHGLTPMAADERRLRAPGGTVDIDALRKTLDAALEQALGARKDGWVASIDASTVSLRRPRPRRALQLATEVLRREPGLWRAVITDEAAGEPATIRHAVFPGRSGDILIVPRPLWTLKKASDGADHGSPWNDDALVPLFVQAPGFHLRSGGGPFDAAQVAPTVAALLDTAPPAAALAAPAAVRDE